ncbi:MAG: hypothetical protein WC451_05020 [Patescibacteria group bacterium]
MKITVDPIRNMSEGIVQKVDTIAANLPSSVYLSNNFIFDEMLGRAVIRKGSTILGTQVADGKSCLGLYTHITTTGIKVPLAVFNASDDGSSVISKYTAETWSDAQIGLTNSANARFLTFLNTTMVSNGINKYSTVDGTTWVDTGGNLDIGNCPLGTLGIEFLDKIYIAGVSSNRDRIYFSSTPDVGAISWTVGNGYIDVEPEEGAGSITALAKVPGYLLIFKERSLKRWDSDSTFPESLMTIGTPSQEAVVMTAQSVYYYSGGHGIYNTTGGYPKKISRRIQDIIEAIPSSYYQSVSGWGDGERLYFSIGDIEIDRFNFNNSVVCYKIDSNVWSLMSFPNEIKKWNTMVDVNGGETIIAGDDDGNVWQMFTGTIDGTMRIPFMLQTQPLEWGSRGLAKELSKIVSYTKQLINCQLYARVNETGNFEPIKVIDQDSLEITTELRGRIFEFRIIGEGISGNQFIGFDFASVNTLASFKE